MNRSDWLASRNARVIEGLVARLPEPFPNAVWRHALGLRFVPETPGRAVEAYWRAHPLRADRLTRALARRSGAPDGWTWRLKSAREKDSPLSFRVPPAPYREMAFGRGPGFCCVCGQPVYRLGWHEDLWDRGPNKNATWHTACVVSWRLWNAPSDYAKLLRRLQQRRCAETGARLWKTSEVDHRVPLFRVWREHRDTDWPSLLAFWGLPNLQVINRDAHTAKCAVEAGTRRRIADVIAV